MRPGHPSARCTATLTREGQDRGQTRRVGFGILIMKRIAAFCLTAWSAAAILYFGQHSVALIALSGVVVLAGFDLFRPDSNRVS